MHDWLDITNILLPRTIIPSAHRLENGQISTGQDGNINSSASAHYLARGQDHMGQMGKLWCPTTTGQDNFILLCTEKIHPAVLEICGPQSLDLTGTRFDKFLGCQYGPYNSTSIGLDNCIELQKVKIHPAVSEICILQSLDPTGTRFGKFLAHDQAHMEQMDKWTWHCTTISLLDNSRELQTENIRPAV